MSSFSDDSPLAFAAEFKEDLKEIDDCLLNRETLSQEGKKIKDDFKVAKEEDARASTEESRRKLVEIESAGRAKARSLKEIDLSIGSKIKKLATNSGVQDVEFIVQAVKCFHEMREGKIIQDRIASAQSLDICFVFDATFSMDKMFEALHQHIESILDFLQRANPNLHCKLGFVAYRDVKDAHLYKHFEWLPLGDSVHEFKEFVRKIKPEGGGDICEDVVGGLKIASEFEWTQQNRMLFLTGDAPCHGRNYYTDEIISKRKTKWGHWDDHPDGLGQSLPILHTLMEKNVEIIFWEIDKSTEEMITRFNEECAQFRGTNDVGRPFAKYIQSVDVTNDIDVEAVKESIMHSVMESTSQSISRNSINASSMAPRPINQTNLTKIAKAVLDMSTIGVAVEGGDTI